MSFSNLKNTFKQKNKETLSIYEEFSKIKEIIKNQLYKQNILSKTWDNILKHLKIFSLMLIINMLILLSFGITIFVPITLNEPYLLYWIIGNILFYIFSKRLTLLSIAKIKEINNHMHFLMLSVTSFTLFSLIEQRDMDSVIIFDDYLVYATAFEIPNKITSKLNENLMNLNIKLQILSNILTL